jgi:hypothetical protein
MGRLYFTRTVLYAGVCAILSSIPGPLRAQNPALSALPAAEIGNRISAINRALVNAAAQPVSPLTAGLLSERAALLSQLISADPARALQLALPADTADRLRAGAPANSVEVRGEWQGRLETTVSDDFEHRRSETRRYLRTSEGPIELFFGIRPPRQGDAVRIRGLKLGERMAVENATPADPVSVIANASAQTACTTTGAQKIAVLMLTMPSNSAFPSGYTQASLQEAFFGSNSDTSDMDSLNGFWKEVSYGLTSATGQVFGPFALNNDYSYSTQSGLATEAINAADSTVDFTQFTHVALVFPNASWGGFAADDSLGCIGVASPSKGHLLLSTGWFPAFPDSSPSVPIVDHELGHALGLNHSSSEDFGNVPLGPLGTPGITEEYGDPFSTMGNDNGHYAGEQKSMLHWLSPGAGYLEVTSPGTFTVMPYEATGDPRALRILRDATTSAWLWVEYRQPLGDVDKTLQRAGSNVFDGGLVRYEDPTLDDLHTFLLDYNPLTTPDTFETAAMTPGTSWSDPWSLLTLSATSAAASGLGVTVNYDPPCAGLQFSATSFPAHGGSGTVTVTAPSSCNWTASTNAGWISFASGTPGNGNGSVQFTVAPNGGGNQQNGYIYVQRQATRIIEYGTARTVVGVSPVYGTGDSGQFTFQFDDASGYQNLTWAYISFGISGCKLQVYLPGKYLYVMVDSGQLVGPLNLTTPGGNLSNSDCSVASSGSSVNGSGTGVQLTLQTSFFSSFAGAKRVSASVSDGSVTTDTQALGTWTVPIVQQPSVTIAASLDGAPFSLDGGAVYEAPATFYWESGSQHTIAWLASIASQPGSRYKFVSWADGGPNPRVITVPSSSTIFTANLQAQYLLTLTASPAVGGGATASPLSADGFYDAGTSVSLSALAAPGYGFWYFSGDASGSSLPQTITMTASRNVTANFYCPVQFPAYLYSPVGAGAAQGILQWQTGSGCTWNVSSDSSWLTLTGTASGSGNGSLAWAVSQNSGASRTGKITFAGGVTNTITVNQDASTSQRPSVASLTPAAASGLSQTFSASLYDPNGAQLVNYVYFNIDPPSGSTGKCDVYFSYFSSQWYGGVSGSGASSIAMPGTGSVSNGVCQLNANAFSFSASGTGATLTFSVSFAPASAGTMMIAGAFSDSQTSTYSQYEVIGQYTVVPSAQTITFAPLPNIPVGSASFTPGATASSGLAVSYVSNTTGVCTVSGSTVTILGAGGCSITASQGGNSTFAAAAPVTQSFTVLFGDIASGDYYYAAINAMAQHGITAGCGSNQYCPQVNVTRDQMAIFLVRAIYGGDNFTYTLAPYFSDVQPATFGFKWIQKLRDLGITSGCTATTYCPTAQVSRDQMAVFIERARLGVSLAGSASSFTYPSTQLFTDVSASEFAYAWIERLKQDNITSGCGAATYCPTLPVTRGDMAIFIMRGAFNQFLAAGTPVLTQINPSTLPLGTSGTYTLTGVNVNFVQGVTQLSPIPGVTIGAVTVTSPTTLTVQLTAAADAVPQPYSILTTTGSEQDVLPNGLVLQ